MKKFRMQVKHWEKQLSSYLAVGRLIPSRCKEHLQINKKKNHPQIKNG